MPTKLAVSQPPSEHGTTLIAPSGRFGYLTIKGAIALVEVFDPLDQLFRLQAGLFEQRPHALDDQHETVDPVVESLNLGRRRCSKGRRRSGHAGRPGGTTLPENVAGNEVHSHDLILGNRAAVSVDSCTDLLQVELFDADKNQRYVVPYRSGSTVTMLNGSLDTVALPDVLRLIAASAKSGLLRIEQTSPSGRIFIVDGQIAFATTRNENDPIDDLLHMEYRADYVGSTEDRRVVDLNELLDSNPDAFHRFLEQMVVEVMSRLLRVNEGRFRFDVDIRSHREIPHSFEVEDMISQANTRSDAWARIFEVVPSSSAPFRMAPRLNDGDQVALGRRDWALLAATGASTSIDEIARSLKIFEFAAAKKVAELTQKGLVEFINTEVSQDTLAADELLSGVFSAGAGEVAREEAATLAPTADEPVEIQLADLDAGEPSEDVPENEDEAPAEEEGPTWLPVDGEDDQNQDEEDDDDPVPLLEELHRLHEAEAADHLAHASENQEAEEPAEDEESEEDFNEDDLEGGDLATRWKNLRKAKRGAHASNE
jgi:hypothetical protein